MPGKLNVGNVDVAFFHGETDGKSQTLGSKSPGLGHPVMTDLGIFDSWCFHFSWNVSVFPVLVRGKMEELEWDTGIWVGFIPDFQALRDG